MGNIVKPPKLTKQQIEQHMLAVTDGDLDPINDGIEGLKIDDSSLKIITFNLGTGISKAGVDERRRIAEQVVHSENPHILFAQELMAPNSGLWKLALKPDIFNCRNSGGDAGILWDTRMLEFQDEIQSDKKSSIISKMSKGDWSPELVSQIGSRTSIVCLKLKTASQYIIAISWHGPSKKNDKVKVETCQALQEFALRVRDEYFDKLVPVPGIVIGGDFNLPLESTDYALHPDFSFPSYEPNPRRRERVKTIDFFLHTEEVTLEDTCALRLSLYEGSSFTREEVDATTEEREHAMDHDPIKAYLVFTPGVCSD